jgi:hypothetical protein
LLTFKVIDTFIERYSRLRGCTDTPSRNKESVRNWLRQHREPIYEKEIAFIQAENADLFPVSMCPRSPLRKCLEGLGLFHWCSLFHRDDIKPGRHAEQGAIFYDDEKIELFISYCICLLGFGMIAAPLWILFRLSEHRKAQLAVITVFVFVLLLGIQAVSVAPRPFDTLAATAA